MLRRAQPLPSTPSSPATLSPWSYITTERLLRDARNLIPQLPEADALCAIARSGLLPGSVLAYHLHLPLYICSRTGVVDPGHGWRLDTLEPSPDVRRIILVDDTCASGHEMARSGRQAATYWPQAEIVRVVVYVTPYASRKVDHFAAVYPGQHYLEWNWANSGHAERAGFDFDGILCRECTPDENDDGPRYREFLIGADPLFLPKRMPIPLIVTACHERYRPLREDWLRRHGLAWKRLVMRDWEYAGGDWQQQVGEWKAGHFRRSGLQLFAESEPEQARVIARSGRPVLCPAAEQVFPGGA